MVDITHFLVNFQALTEYLCDCYSIFPLGFQKENRQHAGNQ